MKKKAILIACSVAVASMVLTHSASIATPGHAGFQASQAAEGASQSPQKTFTTPKEAADALIQAAASFKDRKSTRLNSSHEWISYAVFCLKKKKRKTGI